MGNLVEKSVKSGGKLVPLIIPDVVTPGTGLMNPSVFVDDDGDILVNIRHVSYTLYHSEKYQRFPSIWGPLSYLHPENDPYLRTTNYICKLDDNLLVEKYTKVDTSILDEAPKWTFVGLEDCRLIKWNSQYFLVGVRRDTTDFGEGRMEYSHIDLNKSEWKAQETKRVRIPAPEPDNSYCEKNWVPIIDKPYHFIKWSYPVEVVKANPNIYECEQVELKECLVPPNDQRGGSHLVKWGSLYISISHEVNLFFNYLNQKDAIYRHRLLVWDESLNLIGISKEFSFLDANIEFATGAAVLDGDLLISFGFQDNAAFILKTPKNIVAELIDEALSYGTN